MSEWLRTKTARSVIVDALTARHEELSGEASPPDYDGARQVLAALEKYGYVITSKDDLQAMALALKSAGRVVVTDAELTSYDADRHEMRTWRQETPTPGFVVEVRERRHD